MPSGGIIHWPIQKSGSGTNRLHLYFSRSHDHFHPGALRKFPNSKIIVSDEIQLTKSIQNLGFEVIEIKSDQVVALNSKVNCYIMPTHADDSLMVIHDGSEICVNANDALHAAPIEVQDKFIDLLKAKFGVIDYLFCGYGVASHFPNCFVIPGKDDYKTAVNRQHYFNTIWTRIVEGLEPVYAFPFAADVAFLENQLFYTNEPTHNTERPTSYYQQNAKSAASKVFDIALGFVIEDKQISNPVQRQPFDAQKVQIELVGEIERANRYVVPVMPMSRR